jgi:hypothetical protein
LGKRLARKLARLHFPLVIDQNGMPTMLLAIHSFFGPDGDPVELLLAR